jgi:hypothetical protein
VRPASSRWKRPHPERYHRLVPRNNSSTKQSALTDEPDPRFVPVARALARVPGFSLMESKSGAMRGMMLDGKSFGMSLQGRFMVKLTEERAATLIAEGVGGG